MKFVELPQILRCYNNLAPNVSRHHPKCLCIKLFKVQYLQNYQSKRDNLPLILKLGMSPTLSHSKCEKKLQKNSKLFEKLWKISLG